MSDQTPKDVCAERFAGGELGRVLLALDDLVAYLRGLAAADVAEDHLLVRAMEEGSMAKFIRFEAHGRACELVDGPAEAVRDEDGTIKQCGTFDIGYCRYCIFFRPSRLRVGETFDHDGAKWVVTDNVIDTAPIGAGYTFFRAVRLLPGKKDDAEVGA